MKLFIVTVALFAVYGSALATSEPQKAGVCPKQPEPSPIGICSFDPEKNCINDGGCPLDLKCCGDACNRLCVKPAGSTGPPVQPPPGTLVPNPQPTPGQIVPRPRPTPGQPVPLPNQPSPSAGSKPGVCPQNDSIGICQFDADKNCLSDSVCPDSQKCCQVGCNKVCTNIN